MYFINLVKLATHYFKSNTPVEQILLDNDINYKEQNSRQPDNQLANIFTNYIEQEHSKYGNDIANISNIMQPLLATSLIIDEWYVGIDINVIDNITPLNIIIELINRYKNVTIIIDAKEPKITEEEYHQLQEELYNFTKSLLAYIFNKKQETIYSEAEFKNWLKKC